MVTLSDVERAVELTLPHRVRRQPFQDISDPGRILQNFRKDDSGEELGETGNPAW